MVRLRELAEKAHYSSAEIAEKNGHIAATILLESPDLQQPNFRAIHPDDLRRLFELYDQLYFDALCRKCLEGSALRFRISRRMTRVGGTTTRLRRRGRPATQSFEIAVASTLLFETFSEVRRPIFVNGLECRNRLEALQRIMEHELIHLVELLIWDDSRCSARRFQSIAARFFGHTDHRHQLVTPRERASTTLGSSPGPASAFVWMAANKSASSIESRSGRRCWWKAPRAGLIRTANATQSITFRLDCCSRWSDRDESTARVWADHSALLIASPLPQSIGCIHGERPIEVMQRDAIVAGRDGFSSRTESKCVRSFSIDSASRRTCCRCVIYRCRNPARDRFACGCWSLPSIPPT